MTDEDRQYYIDLLAARLREGFKALLNIESAQAVAELAVYTLAVLEEFSGKSLAK